MPLEAKEVEMTTDVLSPTRLLVATNEGDRPSLRAHLALHGPFPFPRSLSLERRRALIDEVERAGLGGKGGASFPTARKLALYEWASERPLLIANGTEGEPASWKDRSLLLCAPHLVLDGAEVAAATIGATRITVCVSEAADGPARSLQDALIERERSGMTRFQVDVVRTPEGYTTGEESSLLNFLSSGSALPFFRRAKGVPLERRRQVALVQNVETLAHLALIARHGAEWFRAAGRSGEAGTGLVSISGAVERPGVYEIALGATIGEILGYAAVAGALQAVLVGGYGGSWLPTALLATPFAPGSLREAGATMGAGVLVALGRASCGVAETARIVTFLASQGAGQCGPCVFGLPAIAQDLTTLANGTCDGGEFQRLAQRIGLLAGRGACGHPDGAARLVRSALNVFAEDFDAHRHGRPCASSRTKSTLRFGSSEIGRPPSPRNGLLASNPQLLDER
jgi:NADH:ubiquinone oxidoreductase subunit F (NADH-binding)